jgi:hypothetical protein
MNAVQTDFGAKRAVAWIAILCGVMACLCAALFVLVLSQLAAPGIGAVIFFALLTIAAGAFGGWMLLTGWRIRRLHATVTPQALTLAAQRGHKPWLPGPLAQITIPWSEVQGFETFDVRGQEARSNYVLYTSRGDFTLNAAHWHNLDGLLQEVASRTGKASGQVSAERGAAQIELQSARQRMSSAQRIFGWVILCISTPLLLLVIIGMLADGLNGGLFNAAFALGLAISLGAVMAGIGRRK